MTQTFHLSITQLISRLFIDCGTNREDTKRKFRFVTDRIEEWHAGLSRAIPFVPFPKDSLWILCAPTSHFSKVLLLLGSALETFIDVVSFLDIFFWFFTGDLDASTGIVVPKAFFGRCILPGTLVQIIDHPTLPHVLPSVLAQLASLTAELGWSRLVLWSCALVPALVNEVFVPLRSYFFRHLEETDRGDGSGDTNDLLMSYAESFGYLPTRSTHSLRSRAIQSNWDDRWSPTHSDSDDTDEDDSGNVDGSFVDGRFVQRLSFRGRPPSPKIPGILTPPGSPRRGVLRDNSVRFGKLFSIPSHGSDEDGSSRSYDSAADFDIGLSLSSHNLDDLNDIKQ